MAWGPYTKVKRLLEDAVMRALVADAGSALDGSTAYTGNSRAELVAPRHFVYAQRAEPMFADDGTLLHWDVELYIGVATHIDDTTRNAHDALAAAVQDFAMRADVSETLNADTASGVVVLDGIAGWEPQECGESDGPEVVEAVKVKVSARLEE